MSRCRSAPLVVVVLALACGGSELDSEPPVEGVPDADLQMSPATSAVTSSGTRWVRQLGGAGGEHVSAVAARPDGVTVVLTSIDGNAGWNGEPMTLKTGLVWLRPDGTVLSSRTFTGAVDWVRSSMAIGPGNDIWLFVMPANPDATQTYPNFGSGAIIGASVVRLSATGALRWQQYLDPTYPASPITVDASGYAVVGTDDGELQCYGCNAVYRVRPDGTLSWKKQFPGDGVIYDLTTAVGPDGTVITARAGVVTKWTAAGALLWSRTLPGVQTIGVTALGTVALTGSYDRTLSFAGTTLTATSARVFFAAIEANGAPRFLRDAGAGWRADASVSPSGRLQLVLTESHCAFHVQHWGLDGARRWSRRYAATTCPPPYMVRGAAPHDLATATNGDVIVGGGFDLAIDLGLGVLTPRGMTDGFVQTIAP
jgi:hypothetical protein